MANGSKTCSSPWTKDQLFPTLGICSPQEKMFSSSPFLPFPIISHQEEGTTHRAARPVTPRPAHAATPSATPTATAAATTWRGAALPAAPAVASTRHGDTVGGNTASWARRRGTSWAKTAGEAVLMSGKVRLTKYQKNLSNIRANQCKRMWDVVFSLANCETNKSNKS